MEYFKMQWDTAEDKNAHIAILQRIRPIILWNWIFPDCSAAVDAFTNNEDSKNTIKFFLPTLIA